MQSLRYRYKECWLQPFGIASEYVTWAPQRQDLSPVLFNECGLGKSSKHLFSKKITPIYMQYACHLYASGNRRQKYTCGSLVFHGFETVECSRLQYPIHIHTTEGGIWRWGVGLFWFTSIQFILFAGAPVPFLLHKANCIHWYEGGCYSVLSSEKFF